jgi:hypothetical protein
MSTNQEEPSVSSSGSCAEAEEAESEHTPGNWKFVERGRARVLTDDSDCGHQICSVTGYARRDESERIANARLLAAAPDLLEAAREAMRTLRVLGDYHGWSEPIEREYNALKTAIAKAEGEA